LGRGERLGAPSACCHRLSGFLKYGQKRRVVQPRRHTFLQTLLRALAGGRQRPELVAQLLEQLAALLLRLLGGHVAKAGGEVRNGRLDLRQVRLRRERGDLSRDGTQCLYQRILPLPLREPPQCRELFQHCL
jgi:hypothetical protein